MSSLRTISDLDARRAAETTFDRNVVVVAGAGTGKTTLLVNRLVHLLMREPQPVAITQIVALTYTNKAATEMKARLRERLTTLACATTPQTCEGGAVAVDELRMRYGLTADDIAARADSALRDLESAQLGTVHSFAAHLLRLFPLQAGVDPAFREDDGLRFEECFQLAWDVWIDRELGREGAHHHRWRTLLRSTTVEQVRDLAYGLCNDLIDVDAVLAQIERGPDEHLVAWVNSLLEQAQALLAGYDRPKRRKIEHMLAQAIGLLTLLKEQGSQAVEQLDPSVREWLEKDPGETISDWDAQAFSQAVSIIKISKAFLRLNDAYFINLLTLLKPLVSSIKATFARTGWISFDGLLARARRLLWEHPDLRERLKREYRAILIDEFQDTDPVQYEILLALAEQPGAASTVWQDIVLEAGKLCVVGDPKQSIYAFRRADMEAFDRVVEKVVADGGALYSLTTNFRSNPSILGPVNDVFDRLFHRQTLVQPANVRLEGSAQPTGRAAETGVTIQVTAPNLDADPFDAAEAARAEGEVLARWLREDLLTRPGVTAGQVAFLFRKLTQADGYLDALRRYNIPYLIDGEKHFYRRQEVIDLVNVLRVLDHPHDHIALLGVLRSPLGGLSDRDIYDLHEAGGFGYLNEKVLEGWSHPSAETARRLYRRLMSLHRIVTAVPLDEALQMVFDQLPLLELAAASLHGEQAVANLLKVKHTAAALADRPHLTLSGFIDVMMSRLDEQPDETESPLSDETSDAVQILTIHKAKGLEFPIVVLPGLHQGSGRERAAPAVVYDWSTGAYGVSSGPHQTLGYLRVQAKQAERERAERRRVLYVGMTRAKEFLLLSGALVSRSVGETVFEWLNEIGEGEIGDAETKTIRIGASLVPHRVLMTPNRKWPSRAAGTTAEAPMVDPASVAKLWNERTARWETARLAAWYVTPSSVQMTPPVGDPDDAERFDSGAAGKLVGIIAHRILEGWDFALPSAELQRRILPAVESLCQSESQELRAKIADSLAEIFMVFGSSEAYARLASAEILGREVPFVIPWGERQVMAGVIDVVYRLDGKMWIADYKTDRTSASEAQRKAASYAHQAAIYREAVARCLGLPQPNFQFLFLRPGVCVQL